MVDGEFIPQSPADLWNNSAPFDHDLITGATIDDGAAFVLINVGNNTLNLAGTKDRMETALEYMTSHYPGDFEEIKVAIYNQYPGQFHLFHFII